MRQQRLVPVDTRLPLPAPVALDILIAADKLRDNLTLPPSTRPLLVRFRPCLAIFVNYTFFCHAEKGVRCLTCNLTFVRPSQKYVY
jgi:ribosomal protein S27E